MEHKAAPRRWELYPASDVAAGAVNDTLSILATHAKHLMLANVALTKAILAARQAPPDGLQEPARQTDWQPDELAESLAASLPDWMVAPEPTASLPDDQTASPPDSQTASLDGLDASPPFGRPPNVPIVTFSHDDQE